MVSAHSNIHRLSPRLRLVIDNADHKIAIEPDPDVGVVRINALPDGSKSVPAKD